METSRKNETEGGDEGRVTAGMSSAIIWECDKRQPME